MEAAESARDIRSTPNLPIIGKWTGKSNEDGHYEEHMEVKTREALECPSPTIAKSSKMNRAIATETSAEEIYFTLHYDPHVAFKINCSSRKVLLA